MSQGCQPDLIPELLKTITNVIVMPECRNRVSSKTILHHACIHALA